MTNPTVEDLLLAQIHPEEFFQWMGWDLRKNGRSWRGPCPIHGGDNPQAFSFSSRHGRFYCFTHCGSVGNYIQAYQKAKKVSYERALRDLAVWQQIPLTGRPLRTAWTSLVGQKAPTMEQPIELVTLPEVPDWEKRGLMPLESHPRFSRAVIERFHLLRGVEGRYAQRIVFPLYDRQGRWVGNNGRWDGEPDPTRMIPKYLYSPDPFSSRYLLYGEHWAKDAPYWIVHEGVTDVAKAYEHGYMAVATMGAQLTDEQAEILRRHPKPILLGYDGDAAGQQATRRAIQTLFRLHLTDVAVLPIPPDRDPGASNKAEYEAWLQSRVPALVYLAQRSCLP